MPFSSTLAERGVMGNRRYKRYTLTDVQTDGTSIVYTGFRKVIFADAVNTTDNADTFKTTWNDVNDKVTLTAATADDDGTLIVWGL